MPLLSETNEIPWWTGQSVAFALRDGTIESLAGLRNTFRLVNKTSKGLKSAIPSVEGEEDQFLEISVPGGAGRIASVGTPIQYHKKATEMKVSFHIAIEYDEFGMDDGSEFDKDLINSCVTVFAELGRRGSTTGTMFKIAPDQPNVHKQPCPMRNESEAMSYFQ